MSFFFSEKKRKQVAKRGATPVKATQAGRASKDSLTRLGCRACPLDKDNNCTPKMPPELRGTGGVYFLSEGPSERDDEIGKPLRDASGVMLRGLLGSLKSVASFDQVIRDYDHYKEQPSWVAMECCRGLVTKSIEEAKPKLIVGLGILPLQWMLNNSDMVGLRGRVFAVKVGNHSCWFMPTYHPQHVIDKAFEGQDPIRSKLGVCLKFDLQRANQLFEDLPPAQIDTPQQVRAGVQAFNGSGAGQLAKVLKLISEARRAPEKAVDLETFPLRPYSAGAKVLTCALSFESTNFAFAIDHPKAGWKPDEKKAIKEALRDLLSDKTTIIAHNTPFEVEWFIYLLGKDVIFHDVWECTMMQAHFLDERRGKRGGNDEQFQPNPYQALDFLVKQHFGISYKSLFKLDRRHMDKADLDETLIYNGADTKYTLRLFKIQRTLLSNTGLRHAYDEALPRQVSVALMQSLGIDIDQSQNKQMRRLLKSEISHIKGKISGIPEVKDYVARNKTFNPASQPEVIKIFEDYLKVGKQLINSEGKKTVDKGTLARIKHPLAKHIDEFRNRSKLKSTYVDVFRLGKGAFIYPDRKIHPTCNTTFAETGRTSSDTPNNQNWPSRNDKWVRRQVVAAKGYVLVAFDYGQLEACTGAMCSKDKSFVKALWEDYDIHMEWAKRAAYLHPAFIGGKHMLDDKDTMKGWRSLIKNKLVFPAFFGAAKESIAGYILDATGVEVPQHVNNKLFDEFWTTFNGFGNWQKRLMSGYYETGYVESPTGRRRHYPLGRSQAINYPIQSVACDIVCRAMCTLSAMAAETGKWYLHPIMNIHDDLTFAIPDDDKLLDEAIETIYRVMLNPSYDFVNVPLSVSCSVGNNWLEMTEMGKFWSHKDL